MEETNYEWYKASLEAFLRKKNRGRNWVYGDKLAKQFASQLELVMTWEQVMVTREGIAGFEVECRSLGLHEAAWYGNIDGARKLAGWKWIHRLCIESHADIRVYWSLVKKFAKELIDIGANCRLCQHRFEPELLWDHLHTCVMALEREYHEHMLTAIQVDCAICEQRVLLDEYPDHIAICKYKNCADCGIRIQKVDEVAHKDVCRPPVPEVLVCPYCGLNIEINVYSAHVMDCRMRPGNNNCGICGQINTVGHRCIECVLCTETTNVNQWLVFEKCGHVLCGRRDCANDYYEWYQDRGRIECCICRQVSRFPLTKLNPI